MTAYLFIWAAYGFRFHAPAQIDQPLQIDQLMPESPLFQTWGQIFTAYRVLPEAWIAGQLFALQRLSRTSYLFGAISDQGFWSYFPIAFAIKTPLPTLLLSLAAIGQLFFRRQNNSSRWFVLVPAGLYFVLAVASGLNIGLRHILPIYPFLFVLIGEAAASLWTTANPLKKGSLLLLTACYVFSSLAIYPHYLAFFNELAGGAKNGHRILLDSNLDWGQDLNGLKRWMTDNRVKKIFLLYFGKADPMYYGIDAFYLPGSWVMRDSSTGEVPSYLAVSANFIYGRTLFLTERQWAFLKSFQLGEPVATIGYSILVYKLNADAKLYHNMALVLATRGRLDSAVELFREALKIKPDFAEAHENLARVLNLQNKRSEAIFHYQEALRIMKSRPQTSTPP